MRLKMYDGIFLTEDNQLRIASTFVFVTQYSR